MYMNEMVAQEFRTFWEAVKATGTVTHVLGWYQERKIHLPMITRFATTIFAITPSQNKNDRDFYHAGVFT